MTLGSGRPYGSGAPHPSQPAVSEALYELCRGRETAVSMPASDAFHVVEGTADQRCERNAADDRDGQNSRGDRRSRPEYVVEAGLGWSG